MSWLRMYIWASLFLSFTPVLAQAAQQPSAKNPAGGFQLKLSNGYLSVDAKEAPLANILDEVRKQAGFKIEGSIAPEEKITIQFEHVALAEALKRMAKNISIVYTQDPKDKSPRIAKIVLLPGGHKVAAERIESTKSSQTSKTPPPPEPFKFEFDPAKGAEKKPR